MTLVLIAIALYLLATFLLMRSVLRDGNQAPSCWLLPALAAVAAHAGYHTLAALHAASGPDMHFFSALSLIGLGMAGMTAAFGGRGRMATVGVVVFPLAALLLVFYHGYGHAPSTQLGWRLALHAWLALLAYATLGIAALLAMMLWLQERALRRRDFHMWLRALPPLTELETLLFRTIAAGFGLLTLTLLTGVFFVEDFLAQQLLHKTILSVLSWFVFGALLIGRWHHGWRSTQAVHWTLTAMALLVLAFFGSKFFIQMYGVWQH